MKLPQRNFEEIARDRSMSALGQKQTLGKVRRMSALPSKADMEQHGGMSALCQKQTSSPPRRKIDRCTAVLGIRERKQSTSAFPLCHACAFWATHISSLLQPGTNCRGPVCLKRLGMGILYPRNHSVVCRLLARRLASATVRCEPRRRPPLWIMLKNRTTSSPCCRALMG